MTESTLEEKSETAHIKLNFDEYEAERIRMEILINLHISEELSREAKEIRMREFKTVGANIVIGGMIALGLYAILSIANYSLNHRLEESPQPRYELRNEWKPMIEEKRVYRA